MRVFLPLPTKEVPKPEILVSPKAVPPEKLQEDRRGPIQPRILPTKRDYYPLGIIKRKSNDSRPPKEVFMDTATGLVVVDKAKFELWIAVEQNKIAAAGRLF
jgi:hypothetical protein